MRILQVRSCMLLPLLTGSSALRPGGSLLLMPVFTIVFTPFGDTGADARDHQGDRPHGNPRRSQMRVAPWASSPVFSLGEMP